MASKRIEIGLTLTLALALVLMQWDGARAQSGCTTALVSLSPCLNYVTGNTTTPSSSCCSQLSRVVASQPRCLCSVLNGGGSSFGVSINQTLAVALPSACNVQTPPVSRCNGMHIYACVKNIFTVSHHFKDNYNDPYMMGGTSHLIINVMTYILIM